MEPFPTHPIDLYKMFKSTGLYIVNPELEKNVFLIKIHISKVKSINDLNNAFKKVEKISNENGFRLYLLSYNKSISDFRFHGSYYEINFKVL